MGLLDFFKRKADEPAAPATRAEGDQVVLRQLRRAGANLSRPREVIHFLYFPTQVAAEKAATELRGEGYAIDVRPAANAAENPPNPWLMEARAHMIVDEATIEPMRSKFEDLAAAGSGEYDGWEAAAD